MSKTRMCKVGFPISSLEKYIDKIQEKKYSYIVYYFDQQKEELEVLMEYKGKYIMALAKLYEREEEKDKIEEGK